jgi:hypothetical protein
MHLHALFQTNNMAQQTAVEWLIEELGEYFPHEIGGIHLMVNAAKAMEKEQIINAHLEGWSDAYDYLQDNGSKPARQAEEYYNETYK